jgi:hypothetical protein
LIARLHGVEVSSLLIVDHCCVEEIALVGVVTRSVEEFVAIVSSESTAVRIEMRPRSLLERAVRTGRGRRWSLGGP